MRPFPLASRSAPYRGSSLFWSAGARMARVAVVVAGLWLLIGWALQWW